MDEEKAAAYYDDLLRKGEGAARFKQGLGFDSHSSERPCPKAAGYSSMSNFVKSASPGRVEKEITLENVREKLKKRNENADLPQVKHIDVEVPNSKLGLDASINPGKVRDEFDVKKGVPDRGYSKLAELSRIHHQERDRRYSEKTSTETHRNEGSNRRNKNYSGGRRSRSKSPASQSTNSTESPSLRVPKGRRDLEELSVNSSERVGRGSCRSSGKRTHSCRDRNVSSSSPKVLERTRKERRSQHSGDRNSSHRKDRKESRNNSRSSGHKSTSERERVQSFERSRSPSTSMSSLDDQRRSRSRKTDQARNRRQNSKGDDSSYNRQTKTDTNRIRKEREMKDYDWSEGSRRNDPVKVFRTNKSTTPGFSELFLDFDSMTPVEKVKAKMRLQLSNTVAKDAVKGMSGGWERFDFNKDAPLDDDAKLDHFGDGTGACDDTAFLQNSGSTLLSSNNQARKEAQIQAAHEAAIFGVPVNHIDAGNGGSSVEGQQDVLPLQRSTDLDNVKKISSKSFISEKVLATQQGSWRERALKLKEQRVSGSGT